MYNIYCFGDSITRGEYDTSHGGWAERLKAFCMAQAVREGAETETMVYNLGISGETSLGCLKRMESEFEVRKDPKATSVFVFAYGANDAAFLPTENKHLVAMEDFKENLLKFAAFAKSRSGIAIFLTITPVVEELQKVPAYRGKTRNNADIEKYNEIIKQVGLSQGVLVDVYAHFTKNEFETLFSTDGVHPNARGHELISDLLEKTAMENQIL